MASQAVCQTSPGDTDVAQNAWIFRMEQSVDRNVFHVTSISRTYLALNGTTVLLMVKRGRMNAATERLPQEITPKEFREELHPGLHFDKYQFDDRKSLSRSITEHLGQNAAHAGMHFFRARTVKHPHWRAQWADNETQLRRVIAKRAAAWCGRKYYDGTHDLPELIRLCALKVERLKAEKGTNAKRRETIRKSLETIEKFGGYLQFITALAWASYRRGLRGYEIAEEMEISPYAVRTHLFRLNQAAERLGFPTHVRHHAAGRLRRHDQLLKKRATMGYTREDKIEKLHYTASVHALVLKMISQKWKGKEICARLRCSHQDLTACYRRGLAGKFAIDRRGEHGTWTKEKHDEVIRLREAGKSWKEIAKKFDSKPNTLLVTMQYHQKEWGRATHVGPRAGQKGWYTQEVHEEVMRLREAGYTWPEISKQYGHRAREANHYYKVRQNVE